MNTVVTLDFSHVCRYGDSALRYVVADIIPVSTGDVQVRLPQFRVVLDLSDTAVLDSPMVVGPGAVVVNVKLPTGELLSQQVQVDSLDLSATISFVALGVTRIVKGPPPALEHSGECADSTPGGGAGAQHVRAAGESRRRWTAIQLQSRTGGSQADEFRKALQTVAMQSMCPTQGNHGLVRLKSARDDAGAVVERRGTHLFDASEILGRVDTLQAARLQGNGELSQTTWTGEIGDFGKASASNDRIGSRSFVVLYEGGDNLELRQIACVPGAWRTGDGRLAKVAMKVARNPSDETRRLTVEVDDPMVTAMLQYLQAGDIEGSVAVLAAAKLGPRTRLFNPCSAAAGAYVLLHARHHCEVEVWSRWIHDLARSASNLPDAKILYATMLLQTDAGTKGSLQMDATSEASVLRLALDTVIEADRLGPPLFRMGLHLHASNLRILRGTFRNDIEASKRICRAMDRVQALLLRADPTQPFSVFSLGTG